MHKKSGTQTVKVVQRKAIACGWCRVLFTPFYAKRLFCSEKCLKARDDARYYAKNTKRLRLKTANWVANNKQRAQEYQKWYRDHKLCKKSKSQSNSKWAKKNRHLRNSQLALYRACKLQQTPPWLSNLHKIEIQQKYKQAAFLTKITGIVHHVDHIIPLRGKTVRGLHVPWNLQILTQSENCKKGNRCG